LDPLIKNLFCGFKITNKKKQEFIFITIPFASLKGTKRDEKPIVLKHFFFYK